MVRSGAALRLLKLIARNANSVNINRLKSGFLGDPDPNAFNNGLSELTDKQLITSDNNIATLTELGKTALKEYDHFAEDYVFNNEFQFAVLSFLSEYDDFIACEDFPEIILEHAPQKLGSTNSSFNLMNYFQFNSEMKKYVIERYKRYKLSDMGVSKYQHLVKSLPNYVRLLEPKAPSISAPKLDHASVEPVTEIKKYTTHLPLVFIGSASESTKEVHALIGHLKNVCETVPWYADVFKLSEYNIDSLLKAIKDNKPDFAVFVLAGSDKLESRGSEFPAPRDNVIFELGLAMGAISRERVFMVIEDGINLKLPSDLFGITPATFKKPERGTISAALAHAGSQIADKIQELGLRPEDNNKTIDKF